MPLKNSAVWLPPWIPRSRWRRSAPPRLPAAPGREEILLGLMEELGRPAEDLQDSFLEDIPDVEVSGCTGVIAGSNPRSVLMGVYRYFHLAGCRFLRPGPQGEYLPKTELLKLTARYRKKADYPYRGECIEGAVSLENVRDTIYWMPKVGLNLYYIEGIVPYVYFHKWYAHLASRTAYRPGFVTDYDELLEYVKIMEKDIEKTGLLYMSLGHGWMFRRMGVKEGDPASEAASLPEKYRPYLALVNGKRELHNSRTFYTQFCLSDPEARRFLVDTIVEYCRERPNLAFVKPGLADGTNNWCECEECRKWQATDQYVLLLNEIEEALRREGLRTRLSFTSYVETQRPPEKLRLAHPERFLGGAAFGWDYESGYCKKPFEGEEPPYERNSFKAFSPELRMHWNRKWKALNPGLSFYYFEYRFYTDQYADPGYMTISRETSRDMKELAEIGFAGSIDDQTHRNHLPTSLPLLTRAFTLFDRETDFEALKEDYFRAAFGEARAEQVTAYLEQVSRLFHPELIRRDFARVNKARALNTTVEHAELSFVGNAAAAADLEEVIRLMQAFRPLIAEGEKLPDPCQARSWAYLRYHAEICTRLAKVLLLHSQGRPDDAADCFEEWEKYVSEIEPEIQEAFDYYLCDRFLGHLLGFPLFPYYAKSLEELPKRKRSGQDRTHQEIEA